MKIAITGHRPERIPDIQLVRTALYEAFLEFKPEVVIQGMAAGVDLWSAAEAYRAGTPFWAVKPFAGHYPRKDWKTAYDWVWKTAERQVSVSELNKYPGPWIYQQRNIWMVDNADMVLAVWDGSGSGGTANAVEYAEQKRKDIKIIHPRKGKEW